MSVLADTHAVIWYVTASPRMSAAGRAALEETIGRGEAILISAITLVEMRYLVERGRIGAGVLEAVLSASEEAAPRVKVVALDREIAGDLKRIAREAVPDMPDRIIAATAVHLGVELVTADSKIHASGIRVIW